MPNLVALLRRLADEYEKEETGEASEARIKALEDAVAAQAGAETPAEIKDALGDLTDEERALIEQHRSSTPAPDPDPDPDPDPPEPTRPRQRVTQRNVPKIHSGDDEADHVEFVDEEGTVRVRPGRKKGQPYEYDVEDVPDNEDGA